MSKTYKVLDISEIQLPKQGGGLERAFRVKAESTGGTVFALDVDEALTEKQIEAILEAKAAKIEAIRKG